MRTSFLTTVVLSVVTRRQTHGYTTTAAICKAFAWSRNNPLSMTKKDTHETTAESSSAPASSTTTTTEKQQHLQPKAPIMNSPPLPDLAPTAKRLFLVRHGEVINPGGDRAVYYGSMDVPLSPLGEDEAIAAAQYLQQFNLQHVACSPLSRAIFGATKVMELQNAELSSSSSLDNLIVLEGFTEMDRGAWCGLTLEEIGPDLMARFDACDETVTPEGAESYPQLKARVLAARDQLLDHIDPGRAAAVVSHLQVTRSMLSDAIRMPIEEMSKLKIATASITCIDYDGDTQTVHFQSFKPDSGLAKAKDGAN